MSTTPSPPGPAGGNGRIDSDTLVAMLDVADSLPGATALRQRGYDLLDLRPGATVADIGCGTGRAVAELGDRGIRSVGIDVDERMLVVARERWPDADFRSGEACALPFPDGSLDGYRADKVLHALSDPGRALAEARRVLRPGGRIVLSGQDWDGFVIDADDRAVTRAIVHARADAVPSPWAGRRYRNLLRANGFDEVTVEVHTAVLTDSLILAVVVGLARVAREVGAVTAEQAEAWTTEQTRRADDGSLFLAIPVFVASGRA